MVYISANVTKGHILGFLKLLTAAAAAAERIALLSLADRLHELTAVPSH